ncbi:hypothetical protein [Streptomyces sp. NPDC052494]|uniref:hypothetical protein n=1 Tax=Streptomyces sp. NPDC052494 TaxID=3365692 RepID=UPI0037D27677
MAATAVPSPPPGPDDAAAFANELAADDGERAFFGDPLAELVGLDPLGSAEDDPDLMAGYRSLAPGTVIDAGARVRLALHRVYLALVMRVEAVPRAYGGEFAARLDTWSAERVTRQHAVLDALEA